MASWIEITNPLHGGSGWEFGTCLWSPVTNKGGAKSWELMREVQPGDLVFHLLKESAGAGYFLVGASRASNSAQVISEEPPAPDRWKGMAPYYRIPVEKFMRLDKPVAIDEFLRAHQSTLERALSESPKGQFFERKTSGRLQVSLRYIAAAQGEVENLISSLFSSNGKTPGHLELETFSPTADTPAYPDYTPPGTVETRVVRRIRDTALSKKAKAKFAFQCAVCGYRVPLGSDKSYAEAHHLKPLGAGHDGPDTLDNLIVLCPTHHAEFDYGAIAIEPHSMKILHISTSHPLAGTSVRYDLSHLAKDFLIYHLKYIFRGSSPD